MERVFHRWIGPLMAAALVGYVATTWSLRAWLPAPTSAALEIPSGLSPLFPNANTAHAPLKSTPLPVALPANVQLLGTALPSRGAAHALLRVDGKSVALHVGDTLPGGAKLAAVSPRGIEITRDGTRTSVELGAAPVLPSAKTAQGQTPALPTPQKIALAGGCTASAAQRSAGTVLGAELIAGALQNASSIAGMFALKNGKLTVQNSAGVGSLLALRDGDVLRTANGRPLASAADIAQHVLTPLSNAQSVAVEMERQSSAQTLTYLPPGCKAT